MRSVFTRQCHSRYDLLRYRLSYDTYILSRYIHSITGVCILRSISHDPSLTVYNTLSFAIDFEIFDDVIKSIAMPIRFHTCGDPVVAPPFAFVAFLLSCSHNTSESGKHHHALQLMLRTGVATIASCSGERWNRSIYDSIIESIFGLVKVPKLTGDRPSKLDRDRSNGSETSSR